MARRFCSKCGAALEFSAQKFCTICGASIPDTASVVVPARPISGPVIGTGIPVWAFVIVGILVLGAAAYFLLPNIVHMTGTSFAGPAAGTGDCTSLPQPLPVTLLPGVTTIPATGSAVTTVAMKTQPSATTPAPTSLPATAPSTPLPTTTRQPTPTPVTAVPTAEPTAEPTSVITLSITQVPPQPPSSSLTSSTTGAPYIDPAALEGRVHALINIQREQNGLSTLSYDPFLADIARGHSWDMVTRNFFEHMNPDGQLARDRGNDAGYPCIRVVKGGYYTGISENLYQGNRYDSYYSNVGGVITSYNWSSVDDIADRAVTGWMNSPGHRQNILTSRYQLEGIGVSFSPDNKIYITENFC